FITVSFTNLSLEDKIKITCYFFHILTVKLFQTNSQTKVNVQQVKLESIALQFKEVKNELLTV
ncbi:MAG: hypothetical protein ACRDFB_04450, partial [Rhabdochlamydiaceae bacterium]